MTEKVMDIIRMRLLTNQETAAQTLKTSPIQSLIKGKAGVQDQELTKKMQSLEADKLKLQADMLNLQADMLNLQAKNLKMEAKLAKYKGEREKPEPQVFYDYTVRF
jgi:uncharacterized protein YlxW (UPF0749 family)